MQDSVKNLGYIKYHSLSSTRDFEHPGNSISNSCQNISNRTGGKANISENKVTKSLLQNWIF